MSNEQKSYEIGPEILGVVVKCPFCIAQGLEPNPEHAMPLHVFLYTELGKNTLGSLVEEAIALQKDGVEVDDAINEAFGDTLQKDEAGNLMRLSDEQVEEKRKVFPEKMLVESHGGSGPTTTTVDVEPLGGEEDETTLQSSEIVVTEFDVVDTNGYIRIDGMVASNGLFRSKIKLKAVFLDKAGNEVATAKCSIKNVGSDSTVAFTISPDFHVPEYQDVKILAE